MFVVLTLCSETVCVTHDGSVIDTGGVALARKPTRQPSSQMKSGLEPAIAGVPSLALTRMYYMVFKYLSILVFVNVIKQASSKSHTF